MGLFKGREDIYAIRREYNGKVGYYPVYDFDWDNFKRHRAAGGTLNDFTDKRLRPLNETAVACHLLGQEIIGIYPLLPDNSSWFIAADFDQSISGKKKWQDDCQAFITACKAYDLPVYLERSRSGEGGHVWMFFSEPYPATKSRRLSLSLLEKDGVGSTKNKISNFDRLFPNQDEHSGKGYGNLIALPMQQTALENGNSCFIDSSTLELIADQWAYLRAVERIPPSDLDQLLASFIPGANITPSTPAVKSVHSTAKMQVTLDKVVRLFRQETPTQLIDWLKKNLNFRNVDHIIKQKSGKSTYNTEPYFRTLEEKNGMLLLPRGFAGKLLAYCEQQAIPYELDDKRIKLDPIPFKFSGALHLHQQQAVDSTKKKDFGVIVAPPGSGKTVMGLSIIARKQQPALIIVHRRQLLDQWIERIETFLGIPQHRIGRIENGRCITGSEITVGMIQSLGNLPDATYGAFGTILVDECHHIPARTFREMIGNFSTYYLYGLTATPKRKHRDEELIFIHIGKIIHEVVFTAGASDSIRHLAVIIRDTGFFIPFDAKTDNFERLINVLIHDTGRNEIIVRDIKREVMAGRKVLVLAERKAHVAVLSQYLMGALETIAVTGEDSVASRGAKFDQIRAGHFQVLITTGQFMGEGADVDGLDCLVLAHPFSFEGKLIQYLGRVQRSPSKPVIYDYRDHLVAYLEGLFKLRNRYYRKLMQASEIKPFEEIILSFSGKTFTIGFGDNAYSVDQLDLPMSIE